MYTIVDIETTGNGIQGNKITEIAIFKFDGHTIVEEFTSLVNPECEIPYFITALTGIDNDTVRLAPKLHEIASKISAITADTIFVAHSVNFDYNVIKNEFKTIGLDFSLKKLCTVRLSRKLIPGYRSYSLGKLCTSLNIPLTDRHRARGDAHATVLLFQKLLQTQGADTLIQTFLNARSQEATLPPLLPKEQYENLPEKPGIYYFKDSNGHIIYIGKAKNIKKRVLSHFYDKANKEVNMCQKTAAIDFELSGNELLALLMESNAIKTYLPEYNSAQKRKLPQYGIYSYEDRNGIVHLAYNKMKMIPNSLIKLYSLTDCRAYLEQLCTAFNLCPKYCHLQENVPHCSHHSISSCMGICIGKETIETYNMRIKAGINEIKMGNKTIFLKETGRTPNEDVLIWIQDNLYKGYGFIPKDVNIMSTEDIEAYILLQKDTLETQRILQSYLLKKIAIPYFTDTSETILTTKFSL